MRGSKGDEKQPTFTCALDDILTCMLDFRPLKKPKYLQCGHTFCQGCLEKLAVLCTQEEGSTLCCPICTQPTSIRGGGVSDLPDNVTVTQLRDMGQTLLQELQQYQDKDQSHMRCESCSDSGGHPRYVQYFCFKCSEHFCPQCYKQHQSSFKYHAEVIDLHSDVKDMLQVFCVKHGKPVKYYCKSCSNALCTTCCLHDHPQDHCIVDIVDKDTIVQKRVAVNKLKPNVQACLEEATARSQLVQQVREKLYDSYASVDSQLLQAYQQIKQRQEQWLKDWYDSVEKERQQKRTMFAKHLDIIQEDLNFHISSCESLTGFVEHVLKETNSSQPLSLYSDLLARMSTVSKFVPSIDHLNTIPVASLHINTEFMDYLVAPGWLNDGQMDVSFSDGNVCFGAVTPGPIPTTSPAHTPSVGATPHHAPGYTVASGLTQAPVGLSAQGQPQHGATLGQGTFSFLPWELTPLSTGSPETLEPPTTHYQQLLPPVSPGVWHRSFSENYICHSELSEQESDEGDFHRGTTDRSSMPGSGEGVKNTGFKGRAVSETVIAQAATSSRHRSKSESKKMSLISRLFPKSYHKSKTKIETAEADQTKKPQNTSKKPGGGLSKRLSRPKHDEYSLRWQNSGAVLGATSASSQVSRFLTDTCYSDNSWVVADHISTKLLAYDTATGTCKSIYSIAQGGFKPWGVAMSSHDYSKVLHCTDIEGRCVRLFTIEPQEWNMEPLHEWGRGDFFCPYGICVSADTERVIVSDIVPTGPVISIHDREGQLITRITSIYGGAEAQLKYPWYIACDRSRIWVSDRDNSAVKVFDIMSGQFVARFKHRMGCPAGITVDPMGHILVADRSGNHNIAMFTPDGQFVGNVRTKEDVSWPQAICCDPWNMVAVTEYLENSLVTLRCFAKWWCWYYCTMQILGRFHYLLQAAMIMPVLCWLALGQYYSRIYII